VNSKVKAFVTLFKKRAEPKNMLAIARVSDLIEKGLETDLLANEFTRINKEVWGNIIDSQYIWTKEMLMSQFQICPQLLYCAFENGKMVATASGIFTTEEDLKNHKSWLGKTGDGYYTTHKPDGNVGFGADLSVLREAVKKTSDKIMLALLLVTILGEGLKSLFLGSRIPSYHKYKNMKVEDYVFGKRKSGKPLDPELYFYQKLGFEIVEIIPEYMEDPESLNYGVLIRWNNPLYRITKTFPFLKSVIKYVGKKLFIKVPELPQKMTV
jgi:hypothetical protein